MATTWLTISTPTLREQLPGDGADGDPRRRFARAGALEHVADVVVPVLERAGEVGVAGTRPRDRPARSAPVGAGRRLRPRRASSAASSPSPCSESAARSAAGRHAVADAGQRLGAVRLDRHAPAAAVAALAPPQFAVIASKSMRQAGRHAFENRHERLAVRFAGGEKSQHSQSFYPKKLRRPWSAERDFGDDGRNDAGPCVCTAWVMLMLDRYLVAGGRALDLATGNSIRWHARRGNVSPSPLFTARGRSWLIDVDRRGAAPIEIGNESRPWRRRSIDESVIASFRATPIDARDGQPRAFDLTETSAARWMRTHRVLAREARLGRLCADRG